MKTNCSDFGKLSTGEQVHLFTIENKSGAILKLIDYGCRMQAIVMPSRDGFKDVLLGFDTVEEYERDVTHQGAAIGRCANRISDSRFTLNGETYELRHKPGKPHLHGGLTGYDNVMFSGELTSSGAVFKRLSVDMEENYPGNLDVSISYELTEENEIIITYEALSDRDTLCNLTNHSFFDMGAGEGSRQLLTVNADCVTPVDESLIPTGELMPVSGTPFDFRTAVRVEDALKGAHPQLAIGNGIDVNYVLNGAKPSAALESESTGIRMEVYTDAPCVQVYTANMIESLPGKGGAVYGKNCAVCIEPQQYPNFINRPSFPQSVLKAGEPYRTATKLRFAVKR